MNEPTPTLRARKHAHTRVALLRAAVEALAARAFDDLTVQELCERAMVSEATFFNYFPAKGDLLTYYGQLWGIEAAWHDRRSGRRGLAGIDAVFAFAARGMQERPRLWTELIAHQLRGGGRSAPAPVDAVERRVAFPDLDDVESVPEARLDALLLPHLEHAVHHGELPANTLVPAALAQLVALFFGVPVALLGSRSDGIGHLYRQALGNLWDGIRTRAAPHG